MRALSLCLLILLSASQPGPAQNVAREGPGGEPFQPLMSDLAVLDAAEERSDLSCSVQPLDPKLEYDLNFQAGYVIRVPLKDLAGNGNTLRVLFRIESLDGEMEPVWFTKRYDVPRIEPDAKGEAALPGKYRLGPGRYEVSWLMRDRAERVCAKFWEVEARDIDPISGLAAAPDEPKADEVSEEIFAAEPPVQRSRGRLLHAKLMVSFTPMDATKVKLSEYDMRSVVSMVRAIARQPQIGSFSLVAYHAQEERVLFEETDVTRIDFPSLGEAVEASIGGTVNIEQLQDKRSGERFLSELFKKHLGPESPPADVVLFVGPKVVFERLPSGSLLSAPKGPTPPLYYFIYNRNPRSYPWKDAVSAGLKDFSVKEKDITSASEFARAMQQLVEELVRLQAPQS
ncbi:MAG: hypothetical protein GC160_10700 [Acidobacteria bacterium]|nr:hypothetical protein [Acidobacteriota bacterium]